MGTIISSKRVNNGKLVYEVELDYEEAVQLKGHMRNVHIFSEDVDHMPSNISGRGSMEATKYLLVPKELRQNIKLDDEKVTCLKIETPTKIFMIYSVDKLKV